MHNPASHASTSAAALIVGQAGLQQGHRRTKNMATARLSRGTLRLAYLEQRTPDCNLVRAKDAAQRCCSCERGPALDCRSATKRPENGWAKGLAAVGGCLCALCACASQRVSETKRKTEPGRQVDASGRQVRSNSRHDDLKRSPQLQRNSGGLEGRPLAAQALGFVTAAYYSRKR